MHFPCALQSPVGPLDNRVAMGSPRKVLRDIDPKKLEAGYTLDKGTTYCDGLPAATVLSKKVKRQLLALQWIKAHVI